LRTFQFEFSTLFPNWKNILKLIFQNKDFELLNKFAQLTREIRDEMKQRAKEKKKEKKKEKQIEFEMSSIL
jgi:hypothetical protein